VRRDGIKCCGLDYLIYDIFVNCNLVDTPVAVVQYTFT